MSRGWDDRTGLTQPVDGALPGGFHLTVERCLGPCRQVAESHVLERHRQRPVDGPWHRPRIVVGSTGDDGVHQGGVVDGAGEGPHRIDRRGQGVDAADGDAAVGHLEPDYSAQGCRNPDRPARVGAEGYGCEPGRHGRRRAA